jgi:PhnB protein
MQFIPYLDFDGDCRDAFDFYARVFDGQVTRRMTCGESPMAAGMPPETHGRIMHSQLESQGAVLMGANGPPRSASNRGCVNIAVDKAGRGRAHLRRTGRGRQPADAAAGDVLGATLRHADRPLRQGLDDQLPQARGVAAAALPEPDGVGC